MPKIVILDAEERWDRNSTDEHNWWPRVLWIDPGIVSGVAIVWFDPKALLEGKKTAKVLLAYSEMFFHGQENGQSGQIRRYLRLRAKLDEDPGLATGCESFTIRKMNQSYEFLAPVRMRAGIEFGMSTTRPLGADMVGSGVHLFTQSPSDALTSFSNDRLRTLQMYTPGPDHVNDAKRHALLWIRKLVGNPELFKAAHGHEEDWFK